MASPLPPALRRSEADIRSLEVDGDAVPAALVAALRPSEDVRDVGLHPPGNIPAIEDADRTGETGTSPPDRLTAIGVRGQEGRGLLLSILAEARSPLNHRQFMERMRLRGYEPAGKHPPAEITKALVAMQEVENPDSAGYRLRRPSKRPVA